jgi:predicted RNase H-like HicB family nuclease
MKKAFVTVGMTENNYSASVIIADGIVVATGKTFEELKKEMKDAVAFHIECMREDNDPVPEDFNGDYELVYRFDAESLLTHYNGIFTNAALERLTGINQRQLQRYASGKNKPLDRQSKKITSALHRLGTELLAVEL